VGLTADISEAAAMRVKQLVKNGESFTAYDVTLWLRDQLGHTAYVSHEVVKAAVHSAMGVLSADNKYDWKTQQFDGGVARLYYQVEAPATDVNMIAVDSSVIDAIGYDPATDALYVELLTNGKRYRYNGLGAAMFADFLNAESKGAFFNRYIKH